MDYQGSLFSKTDRPGLSQVVAARQGSGASDPRDMIYAFLGFASEALDQDLAIDYGKPCVDIYIDFARYAIKEYDNPKLLSFVSELPSDQRVKGLPSWVPDWSRPPHGLDNEFSSGRTVNWKHRQHGPLFVVIRDPPVLACASRQLDVILSVSDGLSVNCIHSDQRRQFQEELQQIKGTEGTLLKSRRSQKMFKDLCIEAYSTRKREIFSSSDFTAKVFQPAFGKSISGSPERCFMKFPCMTTTRPFPLNSIILLHSFSLTTRARFFNACSSEL